MVNTREVAGTNNRSQEGSRLVTINFIGGRSSEMTSMGKSKMTVPYSSLSQAIQGIQRSGGKIVNVLDSSNPAVQISPAPQLLQPRASQPAYLLHVQSNTKIDLPDNLPLIHIGKPNEKIPPEIDLSPFPDSDIVSRVHAGIWIEPNGSYTLEDFGSSNGTYLNPSFINRSSLTVGKRRLLRKGDRIVLGKDDKVSFIFQTIAANTSNIARTS